MRGSIFSEFRSHLALRWHSSRLPGKDMTYHKASVVHQSSPQSMYLSWPFLVFITHTIVVQCIVMLRGILEYQFVGCGYVKVLHITFTRPYTA